MKARNKKQLALLVGMALSVSVGIGMNPMEAYAATSVGYDGTNYTVTIDGTTKSYASANMTDAITSIKTQLEKEGETVTINGAESFNGNNEAFYTLLGGVASGTGDSITLGKNSTLDFTYDYGTKYTFANGADSTATLKLSGPVDGKDTFTVAGYLSKIEVDSDSNIAPNIVVSDSATVGTIQVTEGTTGAVTVSGDGTVTKLAVEEDVSLNSGVKVGTVEIADGKTLTSTSALNAGTITGAGSLDASGNNITATTIEVNGDVKAAGIDATSITTSGNLEVSGALTAESVSANSVTLNEGASITNKNTAITANTITLDSSLATDASLANLKIASSDGSTVKVKVVTGDGNAATQAQQDAIKALAESSGVDVEVSTTTAEAEKAQETANSAVNGADQALAKVNAFATQDPEDIAAANPFTTKLPGASDIAAVASPTEQQNSALNEAKTALNDAVSALNTHIDAAKGKNNTTLQAELEAKKAELENKANTLSDMAGTADQLRAAVQQAGKTAAAPGIASARSAAVVTEVMTNNVVARTSELRTVAAAVDEGRPAPDNLWFQYKHTNMDVDGGDVYSKSTVKTNNYQLGYDKKIGENDYLGAYIGTTNGSVEFTGPAQSGSADIENSFDFGIYGTHMLPANQYIDYMIHRGKFDTKYSGETWGTTDTGAMIGYGAKIAANERLTWNPYLQLAYDKVSVDSYMAGANKVNSDDSNNWTAKLGINLMDASGLYGGLAYSRGLSGSYNAYINGVPMPTQDNKANVIYLSLGYRAAMSKSVFLDVSAEKTFADYKGWTATGKVNFYF